MNREANERLYERLCLSLRKLREARGLSRTELAHRIGRSPAFVAAYETGHHRMCMEDLFRVAGTLRFNAASMIQGLIAAENDGQDPSR